MHTSSRIIIVGAGVFGLSAALELTRKGYKNIAILDRHVPPVPDGSSVDISRVIRFDYRDAVYAKIAKEAYDVWHSAPEFQGIFFPSANAFIASKAYGRSHVDKCKDVLDSLGLPWEQLPDQETIKNMFPMLYGDKLQSELYGYCNRSSGWADAQKAIAFLRDQCIAGGVSFICGTQGTVVAFQKDKMTDKILAAKTASGHDVQGDYFILSAGAWSSKLAPMYNSTIATAQVLAFIKLTAAEVTALKSLPLYIDYDSGWFSFPPHEETGLLKIAVHGWGYTRTTDKDDLSLPPTTVRSRRTNFAPNDGIARLRAGLQITLPALANRKFERVAVCWYNDTPSGDFIIDYHPDHSNLFLATAGSGHAFKFLPVLGKYIVQGFENSLPRDLAQKWRFRTEYKNKEDTFHGDGSRGGPARREFTTLEKSQL
ncbi:fructosyl amine: oxygen oxidoreductase [Dothidotthia symphoricarpi CBS 119687]|uniref:Fructosyl amine: oxygen oxidoreductase n=1 Tax=Dothidotthia symphoricarpi CBS 119687 TaxID=1392245 RepID=A0A6A5ZUV0_9PLEO|nr:fructosyl amine: oxygen oxidoreductase [Dothidotthia symphoricarpi CBS 119687]KAF2123430.1 fructosyl amine: oxygen oxidoreductase [Dothidotthia symphoricarpi CBS 119687]